MKFGPTTARPSSARKADRRLAFGLLVSLLLHAIVLLLEFGVPNLGLPGAAPPLTVRLANVTPPPDTPASPAIAPAPEPMPPVPSKSKPATGMRLVDPVAAPPPPPAPPPKAKTVVRKDKPRKARRISPPLPARETLVEPSRVITQDSTLNDFSVPLARPEEAQEKTVDLKDAQHGEDEGDAASSAALEAEAARAGLAKAAEEETQRKLAEEARVAAQEAERRAADEVRQQLAAQEREARAAAELAKAETERVKAEQLAQQRAEQEKAQQQVAEQAKQQQLRVEAEQAEQRRAEQQLALARQAEQQRVAQQRLEQQRVEQQRLEQQRLEQKLAEQKLVEQKLAEQKLAEQKLAEQKLAEQKLAEQKLAEQKLAEQKLAEQKLAEQQRADQQRAEQQRAEQQRAEQQRAEQQRADQQRADQQRAEQLAAQRGPATDAGAPTGTGLEGAGPGAGGKEGGKISRDMLGSPLANRARDLVKGIDVLRGNPPPPSPLRDPRRVAVGASERDLPLRMYVESWRQKIERNGTINYPRSWADLKKIDPLVSVAVRKDGTVEDVTIIVSSGRNDMDEAVRRIVRVNARYAPFPPQIAERYDVIDIRRVWRFDDALKLLEEVN